MLFKRQKLFDHAKKFSTDALQFANKITTIWKTSPQNTSESVESKTENNGLDREIPKRRYTSPEKRQQFIDDLRLIQRYKIEYQKW